MVTGVETCERQISRANLPRGASGASTRNQSLLTAWPLAEIVFISLYFQKFIKERDFIMFYRVLSNIIDKYS